MTIFIGGFWEMSLVWHNDNLYPLCVALLIYDPNFTLQTYGGNKKRYTTWV